MPATEASIAPAPGRSQKKKKAAVATEEVAASPAPPAAAPKKRKAPKAEKTDDQEPVEATPAAPQEAKRKASNAAPAPKKRRSETPFKKLSFQAIPAQKSFNDEQVAAFRAERSIVLTDLEDNVLPTDHFKPMRTFADCDTNFSPDIMAAVAGFTAPTPIQSQSWPIIMSGRDVISVAETGSGKTLAFFLPALAHILAQDQSQAPVGNKGSMVLILSPTRELALQIHEVAEKAASLSDLKTVCVYGGVPKHVQIQAIRRGVHIVVGTPGRIIDLMSDGSISLASVSYLVLDEADRMLSMGFEEAVRQIIGVTHPDRQTLMFTATWPAEVRALGSTFLNKPVKVTIGSQDLSACRRVTQVVEVISDDSSVRDARLLELLRLHHSSRKNKVLVFVLYKKEAARLELFLQKKGWSCAAIHGDMSQNARTAAFEGFRTGKQPLLVATDVAARGLDIPNVEFVFNYSFPLTVEDYVHRIGRTGRAGKTGTAHTFFTVKDKDLAGGLSNVLREAEQTVPEALVAFGTGMKRKEHAMYGQHYKGGDNNKPMPKATRTVFDE